MRAEAVEQQDVAGPRPSSASRRGGRAGSTSWTRSSGGRPSGRRHRPSKPTARSRSPRGVEQALARRPRCPRARPRAGAARSSASVPMTTSGWRAGDALAHARACARCSGPPTCGRCRRGARGRSRRSPARPRGSAPASVRKASSTSSRRRGVGVRPRHGARTVHRQSAVPDATVRRYLRGSPANMCADPPARHPHAARCGASRRATTERVGIYACGPDGLQPHPRRQRAALRRLLACSSASSSTRATTRRSWPTSPTSTTRSTTRRASAGVGQRAARAPR